MGQGRPDGPMQGPSMQDSFNILNLLCNGLGACVTPFLRTGFGKNYPGVAGVAALIFMLLYASFEQVPEMFTYIGVWLIAVIIQRAKTFATAKKGIIVHSRYWGDPWLALRMPFVRKESTARNIEPMLCVVAGTFLTAWSPGVGGFVIIGGVANAVAEAIVRETDRKKLEAMRDAEIEQRYLVARYRGEIEQF